MCATQTSALEVRKGRQLPLSQPIARHSKKKHPTTTRTIPSSLTHTATNRLGAIKQLTFVRHGEHHPNISGTGTCLSEAASRAA